MFSGDHPRVVESHRDGRRSCVEGIGDVRRHKRGCNFEDGGDRSYGFKAREWE